MRCAMQSTVNTVQIKFCLQVTFPRGFSSLLAKHMLVEFIHISTAGKCKDHEGSRATFTDRKTCPFLGERLLLPGRSCHPHPRSRKHPSVSGLCLRLSDCSVNNFWDPTTRLFRKMKSCTVSGRTPSLLGLSCVGNTDLVFTFSSLHLCSLKV